MFKNIKRRRLVAQLVRLYACPEMRTPKRFSLQEQIDCSGDVIAYCQTHFTPYERALVFRRMLSGFDGIYGSELYPADVAIITALLELDHLTDYEKARLHILWAKFILAENLCFQCGEDEHLAIAKGLVTTTVYAGLLEEFGILSFYTVLSH